MRIFLRTTLGATLIVLAALTVWSLVQRSAAAQSASAASGLQVPSGCVPAELPAVQALIARTTNPGARAFLQAKANAAEQSALDCAASRSVRAPAVKPAIAALLPTTVPAPLPTQPPGIQHAELLPVGDFIPADTGYNLWSGTVNGHSVQVFTGSIAESDPNWQQAHPDWVAHPEQHVQGAVRVMTDNDGLNAGTYPTPGRHGLLNLVSACGSRLVLQAADGTFFTFDLVALAYVPNSSACPAATP